MSSLLLTDDQARAFEILSGPKNVFLTGAAGSGKSHLVREFLRDKDSKKFPILASTGAAAILVGGRTFHSFFGLGILEGGIQATIERAKKNYPLRKRLMEVEAVIIDEVSMIGGLTLRAAEAIAREVRGRPRPWGGIRVIAVGDFAQLPPVNPFRKDKDWAFLDPIWEVSEFAPALLQEIVRTKDRKFLDVLNFIRDGVINATVQDFLNQKTVKPPVDFEGTRLFARREDVERYNLERLDQIDSPSKEFETVYTGRAKAVEEFKKHAPIPERILLKEGALVMLRQNDMEGRWVNGSLGHLTDLKEDTLGITLLTGRRITVERTEFTLLDADGEPVAIANNFPVTLAYAVTIHKSQGTTLDQMTVDLRRLWEPGQAYVALSRARSAKGLFVEGWHSRSILVDPMVTQFHKSIELLSAPNANVPAF